MPLSLNEIRDRALTSSPVGGTSIQAISAFWRCDSNACVRTGCG